MEQEPTTRLPRVVSLIGLPGAGKTTLARALARRLGWQVFVLGEALRARAANDASLGRVLNNGDLAPEPLVATLVAAAVSQYRGPGLILDGFPRHRDQLALAERMFGDWTILYVDVPVAVAIKRLTSRLICASCGAPVPQSERSSLRCARCSSDECSTRPEDGTEQAQSRVTVFQQLLADLLRSLPTRVVVVDGASPPDYLVAEAARELMIRSS